MSKDKAPRKTKPRIFVSVTGDANLNDRRTALKKGILRSLVDLGFEPTGFEPEEFGLGLRARIQAWSFDEARKLMRRCDGALILGLARTFSSRIDFGPFEPLLAPLPPSQRQAMYELAISGSKDRAAALANVSRAVVEKWLTGDAAFRKAHKTICQSLERQAEQYGRMVDAVASPFNHFEGALAIAQQIPVLILAEEMVEKKGILAFEGGENIAEIPDGVDEQWLAGERYRSALEGWAEEIRKRRDVFMGYSSEASRVAKEIRGHLEDEGFTVLDWARDFGKAGTTILEQMHKAARRCRCAIFLFTASDRLEGKATFKKIPRDNVLIEAGYFMQARGESRVAIIHEKGVKMPADFGGVIYLEMSARAKLGGVKKDLVTFLEEAL